MKKGIDVSCFQGDIDFARVKNDGIEFAIMRTGFGSPSQSQIDTHFYGYYDGFTSVGIPTGAYHYGYAQSVEEAITEANFCLSILDNRDMPYGVWYDVEERNMFNVGRDNLTAIINAFCDTISNAGYKAGVYISCSPAEHNVNMDQIPYYKWIAQYNSSCQYSGDYDIWQYTDRGQVDGITCNTVDMDYAYTDFSPEQPVEYEWVWYNNDQKWAVKENGEWMYNRWIFDKNHWYRLDENGWALKNQWFQENGVWYYLRDDCSMVSNDWIWDDNEKAWYYLNDSGAMVRNLWVWDDNKQAWYYLLESGKMATDMYVPVNGEPKYYVDGNGKWVG